MLEVLKVRRAEIETAVVDADQTWRDPSVTCECNSSPVYSSCVVDSFSSVCS